MSEDSNKIEFSSEGDFGPRISTQQDETTPIRTTIIEQVVEEEASNKIEFSSEGDFGPRISTQRDEVTPIRTTIIEQVVEEEVSNKNDFSSEGDFGPLISTQPEKATPVRTTIIEQAFEQEVSPICDIPWSPIQSPSAKRLHHLVRNVKPISAKKLFLFGKANDDDDIGDETFTGDKENGGSKGNTNDDISMVEIISDEKAKTKPPSQSGKPRKSRLEMLKEEQLKRMPPLRSLDRYKDTSLIFSLESQSVFRMETSPVTKSNYFSFKQQIMDQCYEERKERRLQYEANIKLYERENYDEEELAGDLEMSDDSQDSQYRREDADEEEIEEINTDGGNGEEESGGGYNDEMNARLEPESKDGSEEDGKKDEDMEDLEEEEPESEDVGHDNDGEEEEEDGLEENEADKAFINDDLETSENEEADEGKEKDKETVEKEAVVLLELDGKDNEKQVELEGEANSVVKTSDENKKNEEDDDEPVKLDLPKKKRPMIIDDDEDGVEEQNLDFEDLPTDGENNDDEQEVPEEEEDGEEDTLNQTIKEKTTKKPKGFLLDEAEVSGSDDEADDEFDEGDEAGEDETGEIQEPSIQTKDFILDEAELSGSDSSDEEDPEDEVEGMIGDSDAEELDEDQVRGDIQKMYHKQILNEEKRLVLEMKERYLQDGDLHSDTKRKKNFRWRTVQTEVVDDDRLFSSSSESDEDDDEGNRPWQLKSDLPQKSLNSITSTSASVADVTNNLLISSQLRASLNGPSSDIKSYLVRDEHLKNVLSTTKRPDPFDRYRIGIKKLKPDSSSKTKSLFDLFSS